VLVEAAAGEDPGVRQAGAPAGQGRENLSDGTSEYLRGDEGLWLPASSRGSLRPMREPESDSAAKALDGLRRLEARVDAIAEAVDVLARA
jgi:hypothetical protein